MTTDPARCPSRLAESQSGSMTLFAMMLLLVAILITGGVVDFISLTMQRKEVQSAADRAALAAAQELVLGDDAENRVGAVAAAYVKANHTREATTAAELIDDGRSVRVTVSTAPRVFFPGPVGSGAGPVTASAIGTVSGSPVCMIGLDTKVKHTLWMKKEAAITARGCAIYSNSLAPDGVLVEDSAEVDAEFICSAGGVKTAKNQSLDPAPLTDCPAYPDPLAQRPPPPVGGCDFNKLKVEKGKTLTLSPGTYCKGIEVKDGVVKLQPGVYVIKNGPLKVGDGGRLEGDSVGFFLTGKDALINFEKDSSIRLTAPKDGTMSGLLFYEDRKVKPVDALPANLDYNQMAKATEHRIRSRDATTLVGTIYISRNRLLVGGESPIAAESAYTVIIAREFALEDGPEIVLNTDYASSDIPVPLGVGNRARPAARLVH